MTRILSPDNWDELFSLRCPAAPQPSAAAIDSRSSFESAALEEVEQCYELLPELGQGTVRAIDLAPGMTLTLLDYQLAEAVCTQQQAHEHAVQFTILLSGVIDVNLYPTMSGDRCYFSGSGISHGYSEHIPTQRLVGVDLNLEPAQAAAFLPESVISGDGHLLPLLCLDDWKPSFFLRVTPEIRLAVRQILHCPFQGAVRQLYLQSRVLELLALQIALVQQDQGNARVISQNAGSSLKPDTIARLYEARRLLHERLNHPPTLTELAQLVGISDRTLQRGFRQLFGTTVFGDLHDRRMEQAEELLRGGKMRVSEVAHAIGYTHLGHFTAAFKRRFGITPRDCQRGKRIF